MRASKIVSDHPKPSKGRRLPEWLFPLVTFLIIPPLVVVGVYGAVKKDAPSGHVPTRPAIAQAVASDSVSHPPVASAPTPTTPPGIEDGSNRTTDSAAHLGPLRVRPNRVSAPATKGLSVSSLGSQNQANALQHVAHNSGSALTLSQALPAQTHTYDANDRLLGNGRTYDNNGNLLSEPGKTYHYDSENRLVSVNNGQIRYVYDGDGVLVRKIENGVTTTNLWDEINPTGHAQIIEEKGNGQLAKVHTYGHSRTSTDRLTADGAWELSYYGYDGHGNVRFLTDPTGEITDRYTYDAFGILLDHHGTSPNDYLYCGEKFDISTGLYHLRARFMDPSIGRFLTGDIYEGQNPDPASLHKYLYANADPVNLLDPSGRMSMGEIMTTVAVASMFSATIANAPGPMDRTYAGDVIGADVMVNIVGGQLLGRYLIGPAIGYLGQGVSYATQGVSRLMRPRLSAPTSTVAGGQVLPKSVLESFEGGMFVGGEATAKIVVYRAEGGTSGNFGRFYGTAKPFSSLEAEEMSNIFKWGNTADRLVTYEIPVGARIFRGKVAGGADEQIFIRDPVREGVRIISSEPLLFRTGVPGSPPPGSGME